MIETENLTKRFGGQVSVDDLNLSIRPAEIYGFLGPNGAGKTTTIHMLLNLTRPSRGRVRVFGDEIGRGSFAYRQQIGVVAEEPVELSHLTGWELVSYFARIYGLASPDQRMTELFHALDLWDAREGRAREYSRGMRQKLSLIRALVHRPTLLILDEPVSGLDPHGIRQVRELIHAYRDEGGTVFISSHILSEIERSADRIGILAKGRLLIEDSLAGIRQRLGRGGKLVIELERPSDQLVARLGDHHAVLEVQVNEAGRELGIVLKDGQNARSSISHLIAESGAVVLRMESEELSLEDAFMTITDQNVNRLAGAA